MACVQGAFVNSIIMDESLMVKANPIHVKVNSFQSNPLNYCGISNAHLQLS